MVDWYTNIADVHEGGENGHHKFLYAKENTEKVGEGSTDKVCI